MKATTKKVMILAAEGLNNLFTFAISIPLSVILILVLGKILGFTILDLIPWTWPVSAWLLVTGTAWYLMARVWPKGERTNLSILRYAAWRTIPPTTVGLALVTLTAVSLNLVRGAAKPATATSLRALEFQPISFRNYVDNRLSSCLIFTSSLGIAIVISLWLPQLKTLAALDRLRDVVTALYILLVTITSFTFFSQYPTTRLLTSATSDLSDRIGAELHDYKVLRRQQRNEIAKYIAATVLNRQRFDAQQRKNISRSLKEIAARVESLSIPLTDIFACDEAQAPTLVNLEALVRDASSSSSSNAVLQKYTRDLRCQQIKQYSPVPVKIDREEMQRRMIRGLVSAEWRLVDGVTIAAGRSLHESIEDKMIASRDDLPEDSREGQARLTSLNDNLRTANTQAVEVVAKATQMAISQALGNALGETVPRNIELLGAYFEAVLDYLVEHGCDKVADWFARDRQVVALEGLRVPEDLVAAAPVGPGGIGGNPAAPAVDVSAIIDATRGQARAWLIRETREHPPRSVLSREEIDVIERAKASGEESGGVAPDRSPPIDPSHPGRRTPSRRLETPRAEPRSMP